MELSLTLHGLAELQAYWQRVPEITERHTRVAMEKALLLLQREVAEATPIGAHQLLRKSIIAEPIQVTPVGLLGVVDVAKPGQVGGHIDNAPNFWGYSVPKGKFGSALNYAEAVEEGTKPGRKKPPPIAPLVDWVEKTVQGRSLLNKYGLELKDAPQLARGIAWKIKHKGTQGKHMFANTRNNPKVQAYIQGMFDQALVDIAAELRGEP